MNKKAVKKGILPYVFLFLVMLGILYFFNIANQKVNVIDYQQFLASASENKIKEIVVVPYTRSSLYQIEGTMEGYAENETFVLKMPLAEEVITELLNLQKQYNFKLDTIADPGSNTILLFVVNILPTVILIGFAFFFISKQMGGANKSMDFGKSRAHLSENNKKVTFKQVAGLTEEKQEVAELIDFLKSPAKFQKMGARIPKGVLLVGPPGTGKTLLARAVAGEANVPFFYISGSEFVELFVGVGASRVRDMFKQAKQSAPCLIFIDEIDAVGRQRGTGLGGGHDEREQTLNQLLTEMDGFGANEGIIIIAATNRPDVLDPALLRPGRFDRQVTVSLPDAKEREQILEVHAKDKIFDKDVNLENLSQRTPGFSGADLENLLNEAALLAVRRNRENISMDEIDEATDRVIMGPAKTSRKITEKEKRLVSIHESGHAVIGLKLEDANDVHKITIIPRGVAGGYTMMLPKEEKIAIMTKNEILSQIVGLLGGRVSEELYYGEITTGASDDFKKATRLARSMVTEYGMSDLGPMQLEHQSENVFLGRDYGKTKNFSDQVALEIDKEVRKIIDECYAKATEILKKNKDLVMLLTDALMKYETLTKEQIDYIVEHKDINFKSEDSNEEVEETLAELKKQAKEAGIKGYSKMNKEELKKALEEQNK